jgi:hypothetical protein
MVFSGSIHRDGDGLFAASAIRANCRIISPQGSANTGSTFAESLTALSGLETAEFRNSRIPSLGDGKCLLAVNAAVKPPKCDRAVGVERLT